MIGKNHVITTITTGVLVVSVVGYISKLDYIINNVDIADRFVNILYPGYIDRSNLYISALWAGILVLSLGIGTLVPDIDNRNSLLGRYVYLPLKHRTWTHCFVPLLLLLPVCFASPLGLCFYFGYLLHLLEDSFSAGGICWFYPFQRFREYASGAFVANGHKLKAYHTGKSSETAFVILIVVIELMIIWFTGIYSGGFIAVWSIFSGI